MSTNLFNRHDFAPLSPPETSLSSVRHLDIAAGPVQSLIQRLGGLRAGESATLLTNGTTLHWHAENAPDGWHDVPLRYLSDHHKGFVFSGVAPETPIEFTTHVKIGVSYNHFYSIDRTLEGDLESWGEATHMNTEAPR